MECLVNLDLIDEGYLLKLDWATKKNGALSFRAICLYGPVSLSFGLYEIDGPQYLATQLGPKSLLLHSNGPNNIQKN